MFIPVESNVAPIGRENHYCGFSITKFDRGYNVVSDVLRRVPEIQDAIQALSVVYEQRKLEGVLPKLRGWGPCGATDWYDESDQKLRLIGLNDFPPVLLA